MSVASSGNQDDTSPLLVNTTHGPLQGRHCIGIYNDEYLSFERIPFATPPVGELRFKAPQPLAAWPSDQILDCTKKAPKPLQKNPLTNEIEGDEDCLYLNVYVKKTNTKEPMPVMVFLFGGGFEKGDPTRDLHGPDYFMMKDVIVITVAYRLGPLGFLLLNDPSCEVPGNAGLQDQLMALKWIKQNVQHFGGDPNNITLFGESAGAASVHYMMLSPHAKGLFHKAIQMSGNVLCSWALSTVNNLPQRLAQALGLESSKPSDKDVLHLLQSVKAEDLVKPYLLTKDENLEDSLFQFGPLVEPYEHDNNMIPKQPFEMFASAWGNEIPLMMGGTSFEGLLMFARAHVAPFLVNDLQGNSEYLLPLELRRKHEMPKQKELGERIRNLHFSGEEINMANIMKYCEYATYKVFWHPIWRTIKSRQHYASAPTYLYRFDFDSPDFNHQRIKYCGKQMRGVAHVDDHSYLWFGNFSWKLSTDTLEYKTILRMIDIWTAFAAKSNPNCKSTENIEWNVVENIARDENAKGANDTKKVKCLNISHELKVIDLPELEKLSVWNSLYDD